MKDYEPGAFLERHIGKFVCSRGNFQHYTEPTFLMVIDVFPTEWKGFPHAFMVVFLGPDQVISHKFGNRQYFDGTLRIIYESSH